MPIQHLLLEVRRLRHSRLEQPDCASANANGSCRFIASFALLTFGNAFRNVVSGALPLFSLLGLPLLDAEPYRRPLTLRLIRRLLPAAPPHEETKGGRGKKTADNIRSFGTSETYLLRRLKRDRPELARARRCFGSQATVGLEPGRWRVITLASLAEVY